MTIASARFDKRFLLSAIFVVLLLGSFAWALLNARSGAIPARAPLPKPNGFDLYAAATTALKWPNPPVDQINDSKRRSPQEAAKLYTPARRAAFVVSNARAWNLVQQARAAQTLHPDTRNVSINANIMATLPYKSLRVLARAKTIKAKHFKDLKRPDLALQSGLDTMEMGRDIEHGAPVIGSLVGIAMEAIGNASVEDVPPHLSAAQAQIGAARLEKIIASGISPAEVLSEEKWTVLTGAQNNFGTTSNRLAGIIARPLTASVGPMMDDLIAQSDKPFALQVTPPVPTGFLNTHAALLQPIFSRYGFNAARRENMESSLLLRLALRAYRTQNGSYPNALTQLAPKTIAKIPRDAFGRGEAMRYRKTGDSYLLWSIGPDGKDDGGTPIKIKTGRKRVVIDQKSLGDAVVRP